MVTDEVDKDLEKRLGLKKKVRNILSSGLNIIDRNCEANVQPSSSGEARCALSRCTTKRRSKPRSMAVLLSESPGVAGAWRHGRRKRRELAGAAFGAGEVNWWSGLEERKKYKNLRIQETYSVAGFLP